MVEAAADKAWTSTFEYPKEDRQPEHVLVYGGADLAVRPARAAAPRTTSSGTRDEASRFGAYARRLWDGLLAREEIGDR